MKKYINLIEEFVGNIITADEFKVSYLAMFKAETRMLDDDIYEPLNTLFSDCDSYCANESLRGKDDLSADELHSKASEALEKLRRLI